MTLKECFFLLELEAEATLDDVKRAYRRKAFDLHPDLNPTLEDAGKRFQKVNEAYVLLVRVLENKPPQDKEKSTKHTQKDQHTANHKTSHEQHKEEPSSETQQEKHAEQEPGSQSEQQKTGAQQETKSSSDEFAATSDQKTHTEKEEPSQKDRAKAGAAYAREDVLRNLLDDPFARRVYEDIYREVHKKKDQQEPRRETKTEREKPKGPSNNKINLGSELGKSVSGVVKSWLRQQIDEEIEVFLPEQKIFPGARVRLQIRQGLAQEVKSVEVTLPSDIASYNVIRLKGMGRKVGRWQGDLYIRIRAKN